MNPLVRRIQYHDGFRNWEAVVVLYDSYRGAQDGYLYLSALLGTLGEQSLEERNAKPMGHK